MPKRRSFDRLPTWLPPRSLATWLKVSHPIAKVLIAAAPPRQRRGLTVSKYQFQPDATLAKKCRQLILDLLRDKSFPHRQLLLKEVQQFIKAHGR
jgi:hypothetical protein